MPKDEIKPIEVHWKNVGVGATGNLALHPAMFSEQGYRKLGMFKLAKGNAIRYASHEYCSIVYDRDFVIHWLTKKIIEKLKPQNEEQLEIIVGFLVEAYDRYQQSNQK